MSQWMPIESAPMDGTLIILGNRHGSWMGKWSPFYQSGAKAENPWFSMMLNHDHLPRMSGLVPTHWMPLPPPPEGGQE